MPDLPRWAWTWALALAVVIAAKLVLARRVPGVTLAWTLGWPGMDPERFHRPPTQSPAAAELRGALLCAAIGIYLLLEACAQPPGAIQAWLGLLSCGLVLHFGVIRLVSIFWRFVGYDAQPLFDAPLRSRSLGEFWGRRWNRAFADISHRWIYGPLRRRLGPRPASLAVFAASGLGHDLLLSAPSGGGFGLCTLYFALQGGGVLFERRRPRTRGLTLAVVLLPLPLLFHNTFMERVMTPFLSFLGGLQ